MGPPATTHTGTTPTPQPRRSPPGARAPGAKKPPRHCISPSMAATELTCATPRGEPAASPHHQAPSPGHSHRIPRSSSALPGRMGEDLSPTQDPQQGRFQAISSMCGTTHEHRVIRMIPGIRYPENLNLNLRFKSVTCTQCQRLRRVRSVSVGRGVIPWGYWERFFGSRLFRRRDVWCLCWSERCVWFVLLRFVLMSSRAVVTVVVVVVAAGGRGGWCCDGWW